jgi:hypothetical protein
MRVHGSQVFVILQKDLANDVRFKAIIVIVVIKNLRLLGLLNITENGRLILVHSLLMLYLFGSP